MRKTALTLTLFLFLPVIGFAQSLPHPPASWVSFQQQERAKMAAFFKELKADRDAFLASNPDAKAYLDQVRAAAKARLAQWRAQHPSKNF